MRFDLLLRVLFMSCIIFIRVAIAEDSLFLKSPYLLYTGSIPEMTVMWQLTDMQQCTIDWGTDTICSAGSALTTEYGTDHQHTFTICDLSPGEMYYYRVNCDGICCPGSFHSAPDSSETSLSFMVYGDSRTNFMVHDSVAQAMVLTYTAEPRFQSILFAVGDMIRFGASELSWQMEFFNDAQTHLRQRMQDIPYVQCSGNHELYEKGYLGMNLNTPLMGKYFPYPFVDRRYWSLNYGPAHFTIVDQYPEDYNPSGQGHISPEELTWIENDLRTSSSPWKFVILHEPGWSCGNHHNNEDVQNLLQPLFETYGVQIVFSGHNHYYARACRNGVYHITTGGGGAPLYEPQPGRCNVIFTKSVNQYCLIDINRDVLSFSVLDLNGSVIDSFQIADGFRSSYLLGSVSITNSKSPVDGVLIEVNGESVQPDEIGYYGIQLAPGIYSIRASLEGYETRIFEDIEVTSGTETTLDIVMTRLEE